MNDLIERLYWEPRRIVSERFGWDFWASACKVCGGDIAYENMPEGWSNGGHQGDCPVPEIANQLFRLEGLEH